MCECCGDLHCGEECKCVRMVVVVVVVMVVVEVVEEEEVVVVVVVVVGERDSTIRNGGL